MEISLKELISFMEPEGYIGALQESRDIYRKARILGRMLQDWRKVDELGGCGNTLGERWGRPELKASGGKWIDLHYILKLNWQCLLMDWMWVGAKAKGAAVEDPWISGSVNLMDSAICWVNSSNLSERSSSGKWSSGYDSEFCFGHVELESEYTDGEVS